MLPTQKLLSAIKPLMGFSNFFSIFMFRVKTYEIVWSKKMTILAFAWLLTVIAYKLWIMSHYTFFDFSQAVFKVTDIAFFTLVIISYINYVTHGKSIARTWNNLIKYADFVTDDSYYKKAFRIIILQVLVICGSSFLLISTLYLCGSELELWQELLHMLCNYCLLSHFCGTIILLASSLHFGRKIISLVNEELRTLRCIEHYKSTPVSEVVFVKIEKIEWLRSTMKMIQNENASSLIDIYEKICELCLDLNELFGISLTATWLYFFVEMILCCYVMTFTKSSAVPIFFIWILYYLLLSWILFSSCERFTKETMKTGLLINSLTTENSSTVLKEAVQRLSLNLLHRKVKFTACNLFNLDYKFFYTSLWSIITYFVIFVQFSR